jgi:tRNA pseudouridine-54 N-methylase
MAMDEMTVCMQGRGCFPPNFSIMNLIGAGRYDVICGILNDAKAAQQALPDGLQQRIQG